MDASQPKSGTISQSFSTNHSSDSTNQKNELDVISDFAQQQQNHQLNSQSKELAEQERKHIINDGERGEKFRKHIYYLVLAGIYVVSICLMIMIVIRAYHFVVPEHWKWLDEKHTHDLERIIFSGVIVSLAGSYFKRYNVLEKK